MNNDSMHLNQEFNEKLYNINMSQKPSPVYIRFQPLYDIPHSLATRSILLDDLYYIKKKQNNMMLQNGPKRITEDIHIESILRNYNKPLQWGGEQHK